MNFFSQARGLAAAPIDAEGAPGPRRRPVFLAGIVSALNVYSPITSAWSKWFKMFPNGPKALRRQHIYAPATAVANIGLSMLVARYFGAALGVVWRPLWNLQVGCAVRGHASPRS